MRWTLWVALFGCNGADLEDLDRDGEVASVDCDDLNPAIGAPAVWFLDNDGDGVGQAAEFETACDAPDGYVSASGDCDDANSSVFPDATETCNAVDDDCDGLADDGVQKLTMYRDNDDDGYGTPAQVGEACPGETGWSLESSDCDDDNPEIRPLATEHCDGVDEDCDGSRDEGAVDASIWYLDADGDSFGNTDVWLASCSAVSGYVANDEDCEDAADHIYPGASEVCNFVDDDCNEIIDDDALDVYTWYADNDDDGYGSDAGSVEDCMMPEGYSSILGDCDDSKGYINPETVWYADTDGDGFGSPALKVITCEAPNGYVRVATDCDDSNDQRFPGGGEVCNGVDDDCDGVTDGSNASDAPVWYLDADGDGYGSEELFGRSCSAPLGYVDQAGDCDDASVAVHPGQTEVCDEMDNDCNGDVDDEDEDVSGIPVWYVDVDGDGYGGIASKAQCEEPDGYVSAPGDCDDTEPLRSPGLDEYCNGFDDDCDGLTDLNDPSNLGDDTWYEDADGDGFGSEVSTLTTCLAPQGWQLTSGDCDDQQVLVNPDAEEICNDGIDNNCDLSAGECAPMGTHSITDVWDARWNGNHSSEAAGDRLAGFVDRTNDGAREWLISSVEADRSGASSSGAVYVVSGSATGTATLSNALAVWQGPISNSGFGVSLDSIADWTLDGVPDLVVGASKVDDGGTDAGAVYVLSGAATGTTIVSAGTSVAILRGEDAGDAAGTGAASAGDIDGDGFADLWIGAPGDDLSSTATDRGAVYLMYGPLAGTVDLGVADLKLLGGDTGDAAGTSIRGGVDVNNDGVPDALIGAPKEGSNDRGTVYLITDLAQAEAADTLDQAGVRLVGVEPSGLAGTSFDFAGDLNADGYQDVVIGAPGATTSRGQAYVVLGPIEHTLYLEEADAIYSGENNYEYTGSSVSAAGDVDGDGVDDLLIGARGYNTYRGRAAVILGQAPLGQHTLTAVADVSWTASTTYDYLGSTVRGLGDINGDGRADVAVQSPGMTATYSDTGSIFFILGQGL